MVAEAPLLERLEANPPRRIRRTEVRSSVEPGLFYRLRLTPARETADEVFLCFALFVLVFSTVFLAIIFGADVLELSENFSWRRLAFTPVTLVPLGVSTVASAVAIRKTLRPYLHPLGVSISCEIESFDGLRGEIVANTMYGQAADYSWTLSGEGVPEGLVIRKSFPADETENFFAAHFSPLTALMLAREWEETLESFALGRCRG